MSPIDNAQVRQTKHHQASQGLLSPFLQRQRLKAARPHLHGRVLDIGCGNGALAAFCLSSAYLGIDRDPAALLRAKAEYPGHRFSPGLPESNERFDTIVALAVIEHIADPAATLAEWSGLLAENGHMVLTTPKPSFEWVHEAGAKVGLFSHDAAEEHETLLDRPALEQLLEGTGLRIDTYRTFLGGANQLFVLVR